MSEEIPDETGYNSKLEFKRPIEFHIPECLASKNGTNLTAQSYPIDVALSGKLSANKAINETLGVIIDYDDDEYIVSEPYFHIHGSGPTQAKAIEAFMRIISQIYDDLSEEADHLSKRMQAQLDYLQSKIILTR